MLVILKRNEQNFIVDIWGVSSGIHIPTEEINKAKQFIEYYSKIDPDHYYEMKYINIIPDLNNKSI